MAGPWEVSCVQGSPARIPRACPVEAGDGRGSSASPAWLSRVCPTIHRLDMEEGCTNSLAWLLRDCLALMSPAVKERGTIFLAGLSWACQALWSPSVQAGSAASQTWLPKSYLVLQRPAAHEGAQFTSLPLMHLSGLPETNSG